MKWLLLLGLLIAILGAIFKTYWLIVFGVWLMLVMIVVISMRFATREIEITDLPYQKETD